MCTCSHGGNKDVNPVDLTQVWRPDDEQKPAPVRPGSSPIYREDILLTIEEKIKELDPELRELSLDIHGEI